MKRTRVRLNKQPPQSPKIGRPPIPFDQAIADEICELYVETTETMRSILDRPGMPSYPTVSKWLDANPAFASAYARAREHRAEHFADEIISIADEVDGETESGVVQAARLRVDSRKWCASKLLPGLYGDKIETVNTSKVTIEDRTGPSLSDQILSWTAAEEPAVTPRKPH